MASALTRIDNGLLTAKVMHHRHRPRHNRFTYGVFYLCATLRQLEQLRMPLLGRGKWNLFSLYAPDHGAMDGNAWEPWIRSVLAQEGMAEKANGEVVLITMPRMLGYGFNPVSFWCCMDAEGGLRAVLAEVRNTFGQRHDYFCAHDDGREILLTDCLEAKKVFHVSPFMALVGKYQFQFVVSSSNVAIRIDYHDAEGLMLTTTLTGKRRVLNAASLARCLLSCPLVTWKVITLIHYQALKLVWKRIRYIPLPPLPNTARTRTHS